MAEVPWMIPADGGRIRLEGLYEKGSGPNTVVLCHPHPLYGGSMDNNVVSAAARAFGAAGWSSLRFNFRGVGQSEGDRGSGEKEPGDLLDVIEFVRKSDGGVLHLAGYSFGAWIALEALARGTDPASLLLFSPPLDFLPIAGLVLPERPVLITLGTRDDFCAVESLRSWISGQPAPALDLLDLEIFPGCDHFYWGHEKTLGDKISAFIGRHFAAGAS